MKKTHRNRHHRRLRLMGWLSTRAGLIRIAAEAFNREVRKAPPPMTWQVKAGTPPTPEERAQRIAMPLVVVEVVVPEHLRRPYDPLPVIREMVETLLIPRPQST